MGNLPIIIAIIIIVADYFEGNLQQVYYITFSTLSNFQLTRNFD